MQIGEVAERLGIPASTIRYYEKMGLIETQPRVSGRRSFDERAIFALRFVQLAQTAGFTVAEMKSLLESYAEDPSPGGMWTSLAEGKRATIRQQIKSLKQMDRTLTQLLKCECASLNDCVEIAVGKLRLKQSGR